MHRVFIKKDQIRGDDVDDRFVTLSEDDAHHIQRVLRLRPTDTLLCVVEDSEEQYTASIVSAHKGEIVVALGPKMRVTGEPAVHITLIQGLPKADKMDWVVQKAAEIGTATVVPVQTERSVVRWNENQLERRHQRWQRIVRSAAQQAKRTKLTRIHDVNSLDEALRVWREENPHGVCFVPWEEEQSVGLRTLLRKQSTPSSVCIVIGPEGGLSDEEIAVCKQYGGLPCTLGPRILRTETAGVVVAALVLYEFGDMGG